ncbi:MAG TPA: hydrolase [Pseudonocardiaceae bacterium]|nr:hydrolase [Pseudonocardiaceae bacterium]
MATLTEAAPGIVPLARQYAQVGEHDRRIAPEVADALVTGGFARHFVPERFDGTEGSFTELRSALVTVGEGCASASWLGLILASSGRIAAYLPKEGQHEVWSQGADTPIATALAPSGRAVPEPEGWRLSGRWSFVSGIDFADWAFLCVKPEAGEPMFCAVPNGEYTVDDTWFTVGMRGTGSNTVVVDDTFVPAHRAYPQRDLLTGHSDNADGTGYDVPLLASMPPLFAAPALGAARTALAAWLGLVAERGGTGDSVNRDVLVRTFAELDAADAVTAEATRTADAGVPPRPVVLRNARAAALAADALRTAVDRLYIAGGSSVQAEGDPIQQAWRDIHAATSHNVLRFAWTRDQLASLTWPA